MSSIISRTARIKGRILTVAALPLMAGALATGSTFIHVQKAASQPHAAAVEFMDSATAAPDIEYMDLVLAGGGSCIFLGRLMNVAP